MSIRSNCPCDLDGVCPYESESWGSCEYWCGSEEPQDKPDDWFYDDDGEGECFVCVTCKLPDIGVESQ